MIKNKSMKKVEARPALSKMEASNYIWILST